MHPEPEPNKDEYGPQPNENDEEDKPIPQANETIELENYDPKYNWRRERSLNWCFSYDELTDEDEYHPNIIHIGTHYHVEFDEKEFEEFVEPEFNPELKIHNEPRHEINELDNEPIPQISEPIEPNPEPNPDYD
jgi:hypothetical protein